MELGVELIFGVLFLVVATWTLLSFRAPRCVFLNPLLLPILMWTASYPIWAIARSIFLPEDSRGLESTHLETRLLVVLFATVFVALVGIGSRVSVPARFRRIEPIAAVHVGSREALLIHLVFVAVCGAWMVQLWSGSVFALYEEFAQLTHSFGENLVATVAGALWFALPGCLLAYGVSKKKVFLAESMLLIGLVLTYAMLSTSKGALFQLAVCLLMVSSAFGYGNTKRLATWMIPVVAVVTLFGAYSYEIREKAYFAVRGLSENPLDEIAEVLASAHPGEVIGANLPLVVDRVITYGDALARLIEGKADRSAPLYVLGSLVEIGNLIPRFVWMDRPHLSFNHHVTAAVWGQHGLLSETPIGRVGEAFYVAGWMGLVYGLVYGALFGIVGLSWARLRRSVWGAACAISILLVWVQPEAYLMYGLKSVVFVLVIWRLGRMFIVKASGTVVHSEARWR